MVDIVTPTRDQLYQMADRNPRVTRSLEQLFEFALTSSNALNPDQYGAVGDGVTEDDAAFTEMFAAVGSRGGNIFIPPKSYRLSDDLTISNTTVNVFGVVGSASSRGSTLDFAANKGLQLENNKGSVIDGLRIQGDESSTGALLTIGKLTASSGSDYVGVQNVQILGGYRNMWLQKSLETRFLNCRFTGATGPEGVLLSGGVASEDFKVDAAEFVQTVFSASDGTDCVHLNGGAHSVKMDQCAILFGETGLKLTNSVGSSLFPKFFYFANGGFENSDNYAVFMEEGDDIKFANMYASNDSDSLDAFYTATSVDGWLSIMGSTIRGAGRDGVRHLGGNLMMTGNRVVNNGSGTTGDGLRINATAGKYIVTGNYFGEAPDGTCNQRYGVFNNGAAANGVFSANHFDGNVTGNYGGSTGSAVTGEAP